MNLIKIAINIKIIVFLVENFKNPLLIGQFVHLLHTKRRITELL